MKVILLQKFWCSWWCRTLPTIHQTDTVLYLKKCQTPTKAWDNSVRLFDRCWRSRRLFVVLLEIALHVSAPGSQRLAWSSWARVAMTTETNLMRRARARWCNANRGMHRRSFNDSCYSRPLVPCTKCHAAAREPGNVGSLGPWLPAQRKHGHQPRKNLCRARAEAYSSPEETSSKSFASTCNVRTDRRPSYSWFENIFVLVVMSG